MHDDHHERLLVEVWTAMADHFLDTETRQDIPFTAMRCLDAGLSVEAAREIWDYEVSPAVGFNLLDIAGEWAAWDREWLVERIRKIRKRREGRGALFSWISRRTRVPLLRGVATSVERCMELPRAVPSSEERRRLFHDLSFLARTYFDFCPGSIGALGPGAPERLEALYEPFCTMIEPAALREEVAVGRRRILAALRGEAA